MTEGTVPDLSDLGAVPVESAPDLSDLGAVPVDEPAVSVEDLGRHAEEWEAKKTIAERIAESIPESVTAGLESYGRTMVPIGYQMFERAVGVPREEQERRATEHETAALIGTGLGVAGSLALGSAASNLVKGLAPGAALVTETGAAARQGMQSLLSRGASEVAGKIPSSFAPAANAIGRVAAKTLTGAAVGGAEGAVLGTLLEADESLLKDRPFSAEAALHTALTGAKIGGVLAGAPALAAAVGDTKAGRWLASAAGNTQFKQMAKVLGLSPRDIEVARGQIGPNGLPAVINDAVKYRIAGPFMSAEKMLDRSKAMLDRSGKAIEQFTQEADARLTQEIAPKVDDIVEKISDQVIKKYDQNLTTKGVAEAIAKYASDLKRQFRSGMTLSDVHSVRSELGRPIYGAFGDKIPARSDLAEAYRSIRSILTDEISEGLERAGISEQAWRVPQRQYHVASKINDYAQSLVDSAQSAKPTGVLDAMFAGAGYMAKGVPGATAGLVVKRVPDFLSKSTGWLAGATKNALEANVPAPVIRDLEYFANLKAQQLLSKVPSGPLKPPDAARLEHLRLIGSLDSARRAIRALPDVEPAYVMALDDAHDLLARSHSPHMSPAFAAQRVKQAEDLLTPFARLAPQRTSFQGPAVDLVRAARDEVRGSLAQSDAWGQAYRDAAAKRLIDAAASITDPRRVAALRSLEEMTNGLQSLISRKADGIMGLVGDTTKRLATQSREHDQVTRALHSHVPAFAESEE